MAKTIAQWFGIIVVLAGILGFIPNPIVGAGGMFLTGALLNIIYIIFGLWLFMSSRSGMRKATTAMKTVGILYLLFAILGFISGSSVVGIFAVNGADNWLHLVLAVIFLYGGFMSTSSPVMPSQQM